MGNGKTINTNEVKIYFNGELLATLQPVEIYIDYERIEKEGSSNDERN